MSRRAAAALIALQIASLAMLSDLQRRWNDLERELREELGDHDRYVDFGVRLVTVRKDYEIGTELVPGKPPLVEVAERRFGGIVDTRDFAFIGPSRDPVVWYVSEDAAPLVVHDDSLPTRLLVYGSEGAGKTRAQSMWCGLRVLEATGLGLTIGMTAPTGKRAMHIREAIEATWPSAWWQWSERHQFYRLANGARVVIQSTHKAKKDEGSPVQGGNWGGGSGNDEIQDSIHADADIEMRLRDAPKGRGKRFATATAKDSFEWRNWRDEALKGGWHKAVLLGRRSPFVADGFWDGIVMTARERARRLDVLDVGPERQLYSSWCRTTLDGQPGNLRPLPQIGIEDIASEVLSVRGANYGVLVGHDPGRRTRASYVIKPYKLPRIGRTWWVLDEIVHESGTIQDHVRALLERLRSRWGCNQLDPLGRRSAELARAIVYADPYTDAQSDNHPDRSVYIQFRNHGIDIAPAAVKAVPGGTKPAQIRKDARIDMINRLLCDSDGIRRLFVACDQNGQPCAPRLVQAFETMERDVAGRAEMERKGEGDQSHFGAALGYGLWRFERPVALSHRQKGSAS